MCLQQIDREDAEAAAVAAVVVAAAAVPVLVYFQSMLLFSEMQKCCVHCHLTTVLL